ncbi:MAG: flagellar assembly protein A [Campylobacterota bacterium]|nr:flagellar assembly protein A [Campylobacterota bacterium]
MLKSINLTTNDVRSELQRISKERSIPVSKLYIEVISIDTFVKKGDSDFSEVSSGSFDKYKQEGSLRDKTIELKQQYNIEVESQYEAYPFRDMISEIEFQENDTHAYLVIKKGSKLSYSDALYDDFLDYILEQKLRSNIMIYLFDVDYEEIIEQYVDVIEKIKTITFKEDKKILISKGFDAVKSINADVCMTIEENMGVDVEDSDGRVDYSNRGFLLSCTKGDDLFEFIKPNQGENGRTCKGEIIEVETVNLDAKPVFTVEDSIEVQDSFENIKYLSNKSGYLVKKGNQYEVSNTLDIDEISFKTTGTINSDLDSEISINVVKNNPLEDAVEAGMHVKVQKLSIEGSIGPHTQIESRDISISGQSHEESSIKCVNANIGLHKGKIIGRKVEVKTLEGGEIIADIAIVQNAMRGKIKAKTIEIGVLGSHITMEASQYIQIERVRGEENKFIIDTSVDSGFDNHKKDDDVYNNKLKDELKLLLAALKDITQKIKDNLEPCKRIKAIMIKSKNKGDKISSTILKKYKLCKVMQVRHKN